MLSSVSSLTEKKSSLTFSLAISSSSEWTAQNCPSRRRKHEARYVVISISKDGWDIIVRGGPEWRYVDESSYVKDNYS